VVQVASAVVMIMLPGAFLLMANHVAHLKLLTYMVGLMLFAGAAALAGRFAGIGLPVNADGLFAMWVISFSVGLALFYRQLNWLVRGGLLALAAGWIYWAAGLNVGWLAGWLPGLVAVVVLSLRHSKRLVFAAAALILVLVILNLDYWRVVVEAESAESGVTRLAAWQVNWQITREHLLLGTGPAGYAAYYMAYFPTNAMATHSNYIDILAQTGIIGFALLTWFLVALAWQGYHLCQRLKGRGDFVEGLANAALAGTIGVVVMMGFGDWLFPFAYTQTIAGFDYAVYNWLFMGTILVTDRLTRADADAIRHA
jgi:O-antigen ligase